MDRYSFQPSYLNDQGLLLNYPYSETSKDVKLKKKKKSRKKEIKYTADGHSGKMTKESRKRSSK